MKILMIEDDRKIADAIREILEQETYVVDAVSGGEEGLAHALSDGYDLIILDRMLPGNLDGADICREVRAAHLSTPILMATARDSIEDRVEGLNTGADDYLVKPFSLAEFKARVHALLRRPPHHVAAVMQVGDVSLNTLTREASKGGRTLSLTLTEYRLLEYLMRSAGQVLSRQQLVDRVWDCGADIVYNTVDSHVSSLRRKVGSDYIATVRGYGYKIEAPQ